MMKQTVCYFRIDLDNTAGLVQMDVLQPPSGPQNGR